MGALWTPLILLLLAMYLRFEDFVGRILDGFFGYLFPAVIIALLAALTWWALDRASRGNILGERLSAARDADTETDAIDNDLQTTAETLSANRQSNLDTGAAHVIAADARVRDLLAAADRGRALAAQQLGVEELPDVDVTSLRPITWAQRDRIITALQREQTRGSELDHQARTTAMQPLTPHQTPWTIFQIPTAKVPDLALTSGNSTPAIPPSALSWDLEEEAETNRRRRQPWIIAVSVTIVSASAITWTLFGAPTPW
jgi:hypothetical protein